LWANSPVGSQLSSTTSQPNSRNSFGITMPPTELTASTTTLKRLHHSVDIDQRQGEHPTDMFIVERFA